MCELKIKQQEIPWDDPQSEHMFVATKSKPFVATRNAINMFGDTIILEKLRELQSLARNHQGLDYLQVFENQNGSTNLWFIEDGPGGAITALLPEDY